MRIAILVLLLLTSHAYSETVVVKRVIDGDTFETTDGVRVRLSGVDAPERDQPWGTEASGWLALMIDGREVKLQNESRDMFGRVVAEVSWRGMDVCDAMVSLGHCWVDTRYTSGEREQRLVAFQTRAKSRGVGLWSKPNPIPPKDWRAGIRSIIKSPPVQLPLRPMPPTAYVQPMLPMQIPYEYCAT